MRRCLVISLARIVNCSSMMDSICFSASIRTLGDNGKNKTYSGLSGKPLLHDVFELADLLSPNQVELLSELLVLGNKLLNLVYLLVKDLKLGVGKENGGRKLFVDLVDLKELLLE